MTLTHYLENLDIPVVLVCCNRARSPVQGWPVLTEGKSFMFCGRMIPGMRGPNVVPEHSDTRTGHCSVSENLSVTSGFFFLFGFVLFFASPCLPAVPCECTHLVEALERMTQRSPVGSCVFVWTRTLRWLCSVQGDTLDLC